MASAQPWFRFHRSAIHSTKLLGLEPDMRWAWVELLCMADPRDGSIPFRDCALQLRIGEPAMSERCTQLTAAGLLERRGSGYFIADWDYRQFQGNEGNNARQRKFYANRKARQTGVSSDV
jgi:hypothetical protein